MKNSKFRKCLIALVVVASQFSVVLAADPAWIARGQNGMVACDSKFASQAGLKVLQEGGNAIDAAVTASFTLAVTRPYSTGLGGGGFMIARFADGRVIVQDFREMAPELARANMFVKAMKKNPDSYPPSRYGHLAIGVPGLVAGRCEALKKYGSGSITLKRTLAPAIRLALEGFPVDAHYVKSANKILAVMEKYPDLKKTGKYIYETHLNNGKGFKVNDTLKQPNLARLFVGIANFGPKYFYRGPIARAIINTMDEHYGLISGFDMVGYQVREREPIVSTYREYKIISMPPPSSGGIALAQTLNILEKVDLPAMFKRDEVQAVHYQIEAMKHAFADRSRWLGDADFVEVPTNHLISKAYAATLAYKIDANQSRDAGGYGIRSLPDDAGTSHFCVADRWGNVVVSSETINTPFGSLVAIEEFGLILNNQMDDFVSEPGKPNAYGLIQSENNAIASKKRPLSSMSPTIVLMDDQPFMLLGASGGPHIISSVLNVMLGVMDFDRTLEQAMAHLRPHHQWKPDEVYFNEKPSQAVRSGISGRGHLISEKRLTGAVQAIMKSKDGWVGASDSAKGGIPAGY